MCSLFQFGSMWAVSLSTTAEKVTYAGGDEKMSYIERAKKIVAELRRHYRDHTTVSSTMRFFWLYPGRQLSQGFSIFPINVYLWFYSMNILFHLFFSLLTVRSRDRLLRTKKKSNKLLRHNNENKD